MKLLTRKNYKNILKNVLVFSILFLVLFLLIIPQVSFAQYGLEETAKQAELETEKELPQIIGGIIKSVLGLVGTVCLVLIIYAGFLWMTAGGNAEQVSKAQKVMTSAIIGMAIIFGAYAITFFVVEKLTGGT